MYCVRWIRLDAALFKAQGETIHHDEKVFSLFESHKEWISQGKAGVPVELGLRGAIVIALGSSYGFTIYHFKINYYCFTAKYCI